MKSFHDGKVTLHAGNCLDVLKAMPENSIDAVVTDPPYHLTSIVKRFGNANAAPAKGNEAFIRASRGFMGKQWDGGDIAFRPELWGEVLRVLKPGGHMVCFGGTRTYHRMVCAIEDAGFEIRDQLAWVYGSGFPKSHDIAKQVDKGEGFWRGRSGAVIIEEQPSKGKEYERTDKGDLITDVARQWQGWGTALKPAFEPLCFAQKPLNYEQNRDTIGSALLQLWSRLWFVSSVKGAGPLSTLNPAAYGADVSASAQWSAESASSTRVALCEQMGMQQFESALSSSLSTVSSWRRIWAGSLPHENTSTTGTESSTTIDWKTLRFSLSKITPESIIEAHKSGAWLSANASPAERYFNAAATRLSATLEISVAENALSSEHTCYPDETGQIKPHLTDICLARKPLSESTVAGNVIRWGTGALNIDGCRIPTNEKWDANDLPNAKDGVTWGGDLNKQTSASHELGRWPANLCHDGSPEVLAEFPETVPSSDALRINRVETQFGFGNGRPEGRLSSGHSDSGSAARFFYTAKADADDRLNSKHPTVKPVDLMQWLVRLVCPKGATVLDMFAGTGTTGAATFREGRRCVLIEREAEYLADIEKRMGMLLMGFEERSWKLAKPEPLEALPLFALTEPTA